MKIVRFGEPGKESPGLLLDNEILDMQAMAFNISGVDPLFFKLDGFARADFMNKEAGRKTASLDNRLGPPVSPGGKIVCMGKNYADHAREFGSEPPDYPIFFSKPTSSVIGPNDDIILPAGAKVVDVEVELALVIGKAGRNISEAEAMDHIAGYTILNDVSDRVVQKKGKQWFRAKGADTFCVLGPWLVTKDEIPNPHDLKLISRINGQVIQEGHTGDMIFSIAQQVSQLSETMTLEPGDIIATGTPSGIGSVHNPPITLKDGDQVEIEIPGLGVQKNRVVQA